MFTNSTFPLTLWAVDADNYFGFIYIFGNECVCNPYRDSLNLRYRKIF